MRPPRRICVLVGGGLDSCVLIADLLRRGCQVWPLYIRSGFLWEKAELYWLNRLLQALRSPRLKPLTVSLAPAAPLLGKHWSLNGKGTPGALSAWDSVLLPGRNITLLSLASVFCKSHGLGAVAFAILKGNPFPDAQPKFLKSMERAARRALGTDLRILAPYRDLDKKTVAGLIPGFPAHLTFSCLKPRGLRHCGRCSKCWERQGACAE